MDAEEVISRCNVFLWGERRGEICSIAKIILMGGVDYSTNLNHGIRLINHPRGILLFTDIV